MVQQWKVTRIDERVVRLKAGPAFVASLPYAPSEIVAVPAYAAQPYADPYATFGASPNGVVVPRQWGFGPR